MKLLKVLILFPLLVFFQTIAMALPACPPSGAWDGCVTSFTYSNGVKYFGEFKDNKPHGQGTLNFPNGDKYVGEFKDNKKHGEGHYTFSNGDQYIGEYLDDKAHGQGTYTYADGGKYVGEFKNDVANGTGAFTYGPGDYEGDKYVGEFKNWLRHGQGTYTLANGDKYIGEFKDGEGNGNGVYTFGPGEFEGDKYVGEFRNGKKHGQGTYTLNDGAEYVGEFKDDVADGTGVYTFGPGENAGEKYVGEFKNWFRHGQGHYTFSNGDQYIGEWSNNFANGQGTYTYADGTKYVGEFKDEKFHGQGTVTFISGEFAGDIHVGEFKDGERNGKGTYTLANGDKYVGIWKNNLIIGEGTYYHSDGSEEKWYNGEAIADSKPKEDSIETTTPTPEIAERPNVSDKLEETGSGSGFVVSTSGHIITNHHVINGCNAVYVENSAEKNLNKAQIVATNEEEDLALLKINHQSKSVYPIRETDAQIFDSIYVNGFPLGYTFNKQVKVKRGMIESEGEQGGSPQQNWLQIGASINPGNSGGPVIDENGNIVGVAVAQLDKEWLKDKTKVELIGNINFAIKASIVNKFLIKNNITTKPSTSTQLYPEQLRQRAMLATYYVSCLMTKERYTEMKSKKTMFENVSFIDF